MKGVLFVQNFRTLATDKDFLLSIAENNYDLPVYIEPFDFALALLPNLASEDSELRDDLTYMILARGIIAQRRLNAKQVTALLDTILDEEHLFWKIGESATDTVFMRSYANSMLAAILYNEISSPELDKETIERVKKGLFRYAVEERDWRCYEDGKGWIHTMSHLADALDEYAQHPYTKASVRQEILRLLRYLMTIPQPLYDREDIRLAKVAFHIIIGKQVDAEFLQEWVSSCVVLKDADDAINPEMWIRQNNARNVLQSLFFLLYWDALAPAVAQHIAITLKHIDAEYLDDTTGVS